MLFMRRREWKLLDDLLDIGDPFDKGMVEEHGATLNISHYADRNANTNSYTQFHVHSHAFFMRQYHEDISIPDAARLLAGRFPRRS